jgi:hypothetical protein
MTPIFNETTVALAEALYDRIRMLESRGAPLIEVEGLEKALDMAIARGPAGKPREEMLGDVVRNGRFSARRSRAREARLVQRYLQMEPRYETGRRRSSGDFVSQDSPSANAEAAYLLMAMRAEAVACGSHGQRVLASLIRGEGVAETASSAGVSRATVNRTVRRIRQAARRATV